MTQMSNEGNYSLKPLRAYRKLATFKGRREAGMFLVEGMKAIEQIIMYRPEEIAEILTIGEPRPLFADYPVIQLTEKQLNAVAQTKTPQGTIAVVRIPRDMYSDQLPDESGDKLLLLEDIQDPGNVGTLIRTAAAFDFSGIILSDKCADPLSPKCVQSTAGTVLSLWLRRTGRYLSLVETLKVMGYTLIATDLNGTDDLSVLQGQGKLLLALGNEASGLSEEVLKSSGYRVRVPTLRDKAESLNVAACGAICMYLSS
jgi:TrmH family RNA methyltransferase